MSCRRISRHAADELARQVGLDPTDPRYRNAEVLCRRAQGLEPPFEDNLDLAWQFEQLQRVRRDLADKGIEPEYYLYQAGTESHVAKVIAEFPELIADAAQLDVGPETHQRIDEWLQTGRIALLSELEEELQQATGEYTPVRVPID